ncbi:MULTISPECIES: GGDEF domain-containing protein [unclassified Fibrobacter]|uniref:GGDEF domain-containing protein n=1 Tax=unclassified Fibrobacter TaxID=2634177 RepID=UPI000D6D512B|nr:MULTISPECIES: diguanylate cyclase [unclassified Fibrobacter]PWJ67072.1 diguanylate cyclase (GGDEF)-like protein [Fibrobacter sp. UWR4]PZW70639.1 diguanylate cyclase (GGDEF)-like protein [Fibrobacter sp. UWR1]
MSECLLETLPISRAEFQKLEIFKNVTFESLAGYLLGCKTVVAEAGELLIDPEHPQRRLIIILEGVLEAKVEAKGGNFSTHIEAGHCAGEMSIFDNIKPSANVYAKVRSRLLIIEPNMALAMINASHDLCLNFLHLLSQRLRNNTQVVCEEEYHIRCIEENAKVDALTGLHNRRWLEDMYTREINRSNAGNFKLSAFMMDIDHFKHVNDTYGHLAGDQVLISVAQTIVQCLRPSDMPVRYGGEEFTVFLPGTSTENAKVIAERLRASVERKEITLPSGEIIHATISVGFTERVENDTVSSIIQRADKALYHAKENGRNRVCLTLDGDDMFLF